MTGLEEEELHQDRYSTAPYLLLFTILYSIPVVWLQGRVQQRKRQWGKSVLQDLSEGSQRRECKTQHCCQGMLQVIKWLC